MSAEVDAASGGEIVRPRRWPMIALVVVGSLQIVGWISGIKPLAALGFMTNAAPLPLVFSDFRGIEPFSSRYRIRFVRVDGTERVVDVTPDAYARLEGPYNFRNVFGAVFAFGPKLETPEETAMWESVMRWAFFNPGLVASTLGESTPLARVDVVQESRARGIPGTFVRGIGPR